MGNEHEIWKAEGRLLKELIKQRDLKYGDVVSFLEKDFKATEDVVSNWCRGVTPIPPEARPRLATLLNVKEDALRAAISGASPVRVSDILNLGQDIRADRTGLRHVPIYGALAAGAMAYNFSDAVDFEELPDWGGVFERWGRIISGNSMYMKRPADLDPEIDWDDGFRDGDIAIFENRRHEEGHAVHAFAEGEDTFKVYRRVGVEERLCPLNSEYDTLEAKKYTVKGICVIRIRRRAGGGRDIREYPGGARFNKHIP